MRQREAGRRISSREPRHGRSGRRGQTDRRHRADVPKRYVGDERHGDGKALHFAGISEVGQPARPPPAIPTSVGSLRRMPPLAGRLACQPPRLRRSRGLGLTVERFEGALNARDLG